MIFKLWMAFTVWMLKTGRFDRHYGEWARSVSNAELLERFDSWKQGWPWVEANLTYLIGQLREE